MEAIFKVSSFLVLPFWALMIFLPHWRVTKRLMNSPLVCAAPAILYVALVIPRFPEVWQAISKPELPAVAALLGSPAGATIAWMHFLAFDLFVGRWIYLDSRERGITAWVMAPVLLLTLMLGPCGFLLYLMVRRAKGYIRANETAVSVSAVLK